MYIVRGLVGSPSHLDPFENACSKDKSAKLNTFESGTCTGPRVQEPEVARYEINANANRKRTLDESLLQFDPFTNAC